jgi:hypothetical protein
VLNPSFLGNIKKKVDKVKGLTEAFLVFEAFLPKGWESGITITSKIIGRYGLVGIL